jgi:predicted PurR-regulated permease PerM
VSGRFRSRAGWPDSPAWSPGTRLWVLTMIVVLFAAVWWNVREFTIVVVSAVLLAYVLLPAITWTQRRLRITRAQAALAVYAAVALVVVLLPVVAAPDLVRGLADTDIAAQWDRMTTSVFTALPGTVRLLGRSFALEPFYAELRVQLDAARQAVFGRESLVWLVGIASDFAFTVFGVFVTFITSLYVAMDSERFLSWIAGKIPRDYHPAYDALREDVGAVWQAFFRGQLVLAVIVGMATTLGLLVLGVAYAVPLGLVAAVLEAVPRLGPVLSVLPAVAVAVVQPSATLPDLPRPWFVLIVALLYIVIQNLENNLLVPRILGQSVNLPPAVVLVGALAGATLAGVPGILLAAPVMGSTRVVGSWVFHQLGRFDDG